VTAIDIRSEGTTHPGSLREENEDTFAIDPKLGLYAVFDGMGGHNAGDVAAQTARDLIVSEIASAAGTAGDTAGLLRRTLSAASATIFQQAQGRRDRHGMGTTAVVARVEGNKVTIAHVGDSRAYLLRGARLEQLTADHTVVAAMLAAGAITPEEAVHHPYKNVLSRSLGSRAEVDVDVQEVALLPGDRLLLCSDGLCGYASHEGIEQVLRAAESPVAATTDLIELALRGGGGDNVTAVVVFSGAAALPQATLILRESGAHEWWRRRELFLSEARNLGVTESPICANLDPAEALELVAGSLCEAVFHDLEQTSGIHSWTYAESLASGWLDRGGDYETLRALLDVLRDAAKAVVADIAAANASFAAVLEVEVMRSLIVIEKAVAGAIAERLRRLERELMVTQEESLRPRINTEQPTIPFLGGPRTDAADPEVQACLEQVLARALAATQSDSMITRLCLQQAHELAMQSSGGVELMLAARELHGEHDQGTMPLFEALEHARAAHLRDVKLSAVDVRLKASVMRRLAHAYQGMAHGVAVLIVDAGRPITDQLREMTEHTSRMRERVRRGELRITELEAQLAELAGPTILDEES